MSTRSNYKCYYTGLTLDPIDTYDLPIGRLQKGLLSAWANMYGTRFLLDHTPWDPKDEKETHALQQYYRTILDRSESVELPVEKEWSEIQLDFLQAQFQNIMYAVHEKRYSLDELSSLHSFVKALIAMSLQIDVAFTIEQLMVLHNYLTLLTIGPRAATDMILYLLDKLFVAIFSNTSTEIMTILDNSKINVNRYSLLDQAILRILVNP